VTPWNLECEPDAAELSILVGWFLIVGRASAIIDVALQMQPGNPSCATADTNSHDHYLIQRRRGH
jgi:hypothetical protein